MHPRDLFLCTQILFMPSLAWPWGDLGHRIIAEQGAALVGSTAIANCHLTAAQIVDHVNDPDRIWRQKRWKYPNEAVAHFFHVDEQPADWAALKGARDRRKGILVYRIVDWLEEALKLRKKRDWDGLAEKLYGISHYIGDLTQPLHLHHDHDGIEAGLAGLHSQFETKMLNRFETETRAGVRRRLSSEGVPSHWGALELRKLVFDTARQSSAKAARLFDGARPALQLASKKRKKGSREPRARFVKTALWKGSGELAMDQLALGARLWAHALSAICK